MICWYCHWGWAPEVAAIYDRACAEIDALDDQDNNGKQALLYGPGHVVWSDEDFRRSMVQWCLDHFDEHRPDDFAGDVAEIVRRSLEDLLALPDEVREPEPEGYDGEHPENYPPAVATVRR